MDFSFDSFHAQPPTRKAGTILAVLLLAVGVGGTLSLTLGPVRNWVWVKIGWP